MTAQEKQKLYQVINATTDVANHIAQVVEDKKITWTEALGLMTETGNVQIVINDGKAAFQVYLNGTDEEREDALDYLADELQLPRQDIDAKVDVTIRALGELETHTRGAVSALQTIRTTWQ